MVIVQQPVYSNSTPTPSSVTSSTGEIVTDIYAVSMLTYLVNDITNSIPSKVSISLAPGEDYYEEAIQIYKDYKVQSPNETNPIIVQSMMSLYSRIGKMEECLEICKNEIINKNQEKLPLMYSILIEGYLKCGGDKVGVAEELLQQYLNDENTIDKKENIKRLGINLLNNGYHSMAEKVFIHCDQFDWLDLKLHTLIINGYLKSDLNKARKWLLICTSNNNESTGLSETECNELVKQFKTCHLLNQLDESNKREDLLSLLNNSIEYPIKDQVLFKELVDKLFYQNQMYKEVCELFNKNKKYNPDIFKDCWAAIMKSWIKYEPPKGIKDINQVWLSNPTVDLKSNNGFDIYCELMEKCIEKQILPLETLNFIKFINIELTYISEKSFLYKSTHRFVECYFGQTQLPQQYQPPLEPNNAITELFKITERHKEIRESCLIKIIVKGLLTTMETSNNPDSLYDSIVLIVKNSLENKSAKIKKITWEGIFRDIPIKSKAFTTLEKLIKNETNENIEKYLPSQNKILN